MNKTYFEELLTRCCKILTDEALKLPFMTSLQFEIRVREILAEQTEADNTFTIDFNPHPQAFPDIAMGEYGVEVKFTKQDTWRCIANSVLETQRIEDVKHIYIVFGKMGGKPEVRWGEWEDSIVHVRTSHVPRFEVEVGIDKHSREPLFRQMGIGYDDFRKLPMQQKIILLPVFRQSLTFI